MKVKPVKPITSDNPTSEEIPPVAPPSVGSGEPFTVNETLAPKEELAEIIESIEDISEEVNADVKKAVKIEADKQIKDKELETDYDELIEFEIEENEPRKSNTKMILGVLVIGLSFGYYALKKGNKKPTNEAIEKELQEGKSQDVETNQETGMFY